MVLIGYQINVQAIIGEASNWWLLTDQAWAHGRGPGWLAGGGDQVHHMTQA